MTDQTTDTERQQRRETLRNLIEHTLAGKTLQPYEASALASCVNGEQAEADDLRTALRLAREDSAEGWARLRRSDEQREQAAARLTKARQQRNEAREQIDAYRKDANDRRYALSAALGLGTAGSWAAITERARELADARENAVSCDLIDGIRRDLADALSEPRGRAWDDLISRAAAVRADWARCRDEAEANARTDVAAARQAEEQAGATLTLRHRQLAEALHQGPATSWPDLINAAFRAFRAADLLAGAERDRQDAEQHRRSLAAILAKPAETPFAELTEYAAQRLTRAGERIIAAEQQAATAESRATAAATREHNTAATLRAAEDQLAEARKRAEALRVDAATQGQIVKQRTERADALARQLADARQLAERLRGQRDRWRTHAHQAVAGMAADLDAYAEPVSARKPAFVGADHPLHELIDGLTDDSALTEDAARALIGRYYDAITNGVPAEAEHTCPDGEPCPDHDEPAPDGAALWISIRDIAARDTEWWRKQISHLSTLDRRGLL